MKFWDSSAIAPLLITEKDSAKREKHLKEDPEILVWYGTLAEIESALNRRKREGSILPKDEKLARHRLEILANTWAEVQPTKAVRARCLRLLRVHPLRAADSFHLAAALAACQEQTQDFQFLTSDLRLAEAATAEGFTVT